MHSFEILERDKNFVTTSVDDMWPHITLSPLRKWCLSSSGARPKRKEKKKKITWHDSSKVVNMFSPMNIALQRRYFEPTWLSLKAMKLYINSAFHVSNDTVEPFQILERKESGERLRLQSFSHQRWYRNIIKERGNCGHKFNISVHDTLPPLSYITVTGLGFVRANTPPNYLCDSLDHLSPFFKGGEFQILSRLWSNRDFSAVR